MVAHDMELISAIGRMSLYYSMVLTLVLTILYMGLVYEGIEAEMLVPATIPATKFFELSAKIAHDFPHGEITLDPYNQLKLIYLALTVLMPAAVGILVMFLTALIETGVILASLLPSELGVLKLPLIFVCTFLQLCMYYYLASTIISKIRGTPIWPSSV